VCPCVCVLSHLNFDFYLACWFTSILSKVKFAHQGRGVKDVYFSEVVVYVTTRHI